jgi:hypothetical protein
VLLVELYTAVGESAFAVDAMFHVEVTALPMSASTLECQEAIMNHLLQRISWSVGPRRLDMAAKCQERVPVSRDP